MAARTCHYPGQYSFKKLKVVVPVTQSDLLVLAFLFGFWSNSGFISKSLSSHKAPHGTAPSYIYGWMIPQAS